MRIPLIIGLAFAFVLAVVAQQPKDRTLPASSGWVLRFDGIGPVKIGSPLSGLKKLFHNDVKEVESGNDGCFYIQSPKHPQLGFMIIDNHVARIDVTEPGVKSAEGIQVGDSEASAMAAYQHLEVEPSAYTAPDGHYLTTHSPDGRSGLRFETYKGKITGFYAGTPETIQYIEGCD